MFVSCVFVLSCVGRGLCDGLITSPEESYRVSNCVWLRNLKGGGQGPIWAVEPVDGCGYFRVHKHWAIKWQRKCFWLLEPAMWLAKAVSSNGTGDWVWRVQCWVWLVSHYVTRAHVYMRVTLVTKLTSSALSGAVKEPRSRESIEITEYWRNNLSFPNFVSTTDIQEF
jgi:hypothetical protein